MKLHELKNISLYHYIGDCTNSFDEDGGECTFTNYRDTSDFACGLETARYITKEDFIKNCSNDSIKFIGNSNKFLYDKDHDVYIAYDEHFDIHYFFIK